jgi:hypothetical protein
LYSIPKPSQLTGFQLVEDPKTTVMAQFAHHPLAIPYVPQAGPNEYYLIILRLIG